MTHLTEAIEIISRCINDMDRGAFESLVQDCCKTIENKGKIIITGLGKNGPICEKVVSSMVSIEIDAEYVHTGDALHGDLGVIDENDLVILTSKSGNTPETIQLAQTLKNYPGTTTWALTFNKEGDLIKQKLTDKALIMNLGKEGDPWNLMPMNSCTVLLIVLQALTVEIIEKTGLTKRDFLMNHPGGGIGRFNKVK